MSQNSHQEVNITRGVKIQRGRKLNNNTSGILLLLLLKIKIRIIIVYRNYVLRFEKTGRNYDKLG
jgi:hypothetical protein